MKIFVQIASYRDPELIHTIKHCIARSKNPSNLTFGICWQKEDDDVSVLEYVNNPNFSVAIVPYKKSKGACWARHITNQMLKGEDFTLQIDSHMRFVKHWDAKMLDLWRSLKDSKAVLTAYPPQYEPGQKEKEWKTGPQICNVHNFKDGLTEQKPKEIDQSHVKPIKAVHVAAGFIFGPSTIIKEVPYDPEFYFIGEETALTVRLYTHGYNLYHPHINLIHHYYERKEQPKHWTDDTEWVAHGNVARERIECLLGRSNKHDLGSYTLGKVRTLTDFQNYAGIDYARKIIHLDTIAGKEPPVNTQDAYKWSYVKQEFNKIICWNYDKIDICEDPRFWAFIIKDQNDQELYREDVKYVDGKDVLDGKITQRLFKFTYYHPGQKPSTFIIWPYSESKQWLNYAKWKL